MLKIVLHGCTKYLSHQHLLYSQLEKEFSPYRHLVCDALVKPQLMLTMIQLQYSNIELFTRVVYLPHVYVCIHDFFIFLKSKSDTNLLVLFDIYSDYVNG